jgi:uncharacterized lipoprotein
MKSRIYLLTVALLLLGGCSETPKFFWDTDEGKGGQPGAEVVKAPSRPALVVPPELRKDQAAVPEASDVAVEAAMPERYKKEVAGQQVGLDARVYETPVAHVFSTVVDAMTGLNMPVQSVDSPSGTVTSDWVHVSANNPNAFSAAVGGVFGGGETMQRYRFVVRVLRQGEAKPGEPAKSRLEIRTISQVFINRHWVNRKLKRNYSKELFNAVEERLGVSSPAQ